MRIGPSLQASLEVTVPDCGYYGLFRFREAVWKVDGVYQRDDCFRGNRTNPFLFNDHLPNCTYRKIITRPISPGNKTASFSHMRHRRLPLSLSLIPFRRLTIIRCSPRGRRRSSNQHQRWIERKKGGKEWKGRAGRGREGRARVPFSWSTKCLPPLEGTATRERTGATSGPLDERPTETGESHGWKREETREGEEQTDHSHPPSTLFVVLVLRP